MDESSVEPKSAAALALPGTDPCHERVPLLGCSSGTRDICSLIVSIVSRIDVEAVGLTTYSAVVACSAVAAVDMHCAVLLSKRLEVRSTEVAQTLVVSLRHLCAVVAVKLLHDEMLTQAFPCGH